MSRSSRAVAEAPSTYDISATAGPVNAQFGAFIGASYVGGWGSACASPFLAMERACGSAHAFAWLTMSYGFTR